MPAKAMARGPWWQSPVVRRLEDEIDGLRAEIDRLRSLLAPPSTKLPARWGLMPREAAFISLLYAQAGCVSHARLAAALAGSNGPISRENLQVIVSHLRKKVAQHGIEIEAYRGAGYGLSPEGRAAVRRAVEAIERLRRA